MYETLAFVDALVNDKPAPCSGEDGLVALVMAIAAGKSAEEKRWVSFKELAPDLCAGMGPGVEKELIGPKGELKFDVLTNPSTGIISAKKQTPALLFERIAGKIWVPPSRPDLKKAMKK